MAVGEGEDRLRVGEVVEVQVRFADAPGFDRVAGIFDHAASSSMSSPRSSTTTSAPWARRASAWLTRSTPTTWPKLPGAAGLDPGDGVLEDAGGGGLDPERFRPGQVGVRRGLPFQVLLVGDDAVDPRLEEVGDPGRLEHVLAVGAGGDDGAPQAGGAGGLDEGDRALVGLDPVLVDQLEDQLVLAVAEPADGFRVGRIVGSPSGSSIPRDSRNERTPS